MPKMPPLTQLYSAATGSCTTDEGLTEGPEIPLTPQIPAMPPRRVGDDVETDILKYLTDQGPTGASVEHTMEISAAVAVAAGDGLRAGVEESKGNTESEVEEDNAGAVTDSAARLAEPPGHVVKEGKPPFMSRGGIKALSAPPRMTWPTRRTSSVRPTRKGMEETKTPRAGSLAAVGGGKSDAGRDSAGAGDTRVLPHRLSLDRPAMKRIDECIAAKALESQAAQEESNSDASKSAPAANTALSRGSEAFAAESAPPASPQPEDTSTEARVQANILGAMGSEGTPRVVSAVDEKEQKGTIKESKLDETGGVARAAPVSTIENPAQVDVGAQQPARASDRPVRRGIARAQSVPLGSLSQDDPYAKFSEDDELVTVCGKESCVIC